MPPVPGAHAPRLRSASPTRGMESSDEMERKKEYGRELLQQIKEAKERQEMDKHLWWLGTGRLSAMQVTGCQGERMLRASSWGKAPFRSHVNEFRRSSPRSPRMHCNLGLILFLSALTKAVLSVDA